MQYWIPLDALNAFVRRNKKGYPFQVEERQRPFWLFDGIPDGLLECLVRNQLILGHVAREHTVRQRRRRIVVVYRTPAVPASHVVREDTIRYRGRNLIVVHAAAVLAVSLRDRESVQCGVVSPDDATAGVFAVDDGFVFGPVALLAGGFRSHETAVDLDAFGHDNNGTVRGGVGSFHRGNPDFIAGGRGIDATLDGVERRGPRCAVLGSGIVCINAPDRRRTIPTDRAREYQRND